MSETGWGEFAVQIRLQFVAESSEKPLTLTHPIKLHHWGVPLYPAPASLPVPVAPAMLAEGDTPAREDTMTAGATPMTAGTDVESLTPAPPTATTDVEMAAQGEAGASGSTAGEEASAEAKPSDNQESSQEAKPDVAESSSKPLSLPVHSWHYDELLFCYPLPAFYNLMSNHPATPLPVRSKRPRSQRATIEEDGVKKAKVVVTVKADTATPAPTAAPIEETKEEAATDAAEPNPNTDETQIEEQEIVVDVVPTQNLAGVGELSSADVPMEFTQTMEKEEAKRLDEIRISMVEQMDQWR